LVDWCVDSWFAQHHAASLTDEFKRWWILFYGHPSQYAGDDTESRHNYWVRCAFSLIGWNARGSIDNDQQDL
jgi:hypothetical protein